LMVSRIQYPHILNQYLRGKKPFGYLIRVLLLVFVVWIIRIQAALVLMFCGFAAASLVKWLYYKALHKKLRFLSTARTASIDTEKNQSFKEDDIACEVKE
jgi:hypothetical protein